MLILPFLSLKSMILGGLRENVNIKEVEMNLSGNDVRKQVSTRYYNYPP